MITTGGYFEYLKIAEGCDKRCTYCIIKLREITSVPMEQLLSQAAYLAEQGVKELILVAQETTVYGKDLYGEKSLHKLLRAIIQNTGDSVDSDSLLLSGGNLSGTHTDYEGRNENLSLPGFAHSTSSRILKRMGRRTANRSSWAFITDSEKRFLTSFSRTTLIGFPGETQEDHEELLDFIDRLEFDRLGVFSYSAERILLQPDAGPDWEASCWTDRRN